MSETRFFKNTKLEFSIPEERATLMICMGVSLVFWILMKMSGTYRTEKLIQPDFVVPQDKVLSSIPPKTIRTVVSGSGWDLMYEFFQNDDPIIEIDLSDWETFTISESQLQNIIEGQLTDGVNVVSVSYDLISLQVEDRVFKKVPVILKDSVRLASQYALLDSLILTPDSVVVSGPSKKIDSLLFWETVAFSIDPIRKNFSQTIALKKPLLDAIRLETSSIQLAVKVEEITEKFIFVPINVRNATDSLRIFPDKIRLNVSVGLSRYNTLSSQYFTAEVDFKDLPPNRTSNTLPIKITRQPEYIESLNFSPKSVEFFIIEKEE